MIALLAVMVLGSAYANERTKLMGLSQAQHISPDSFHSLVSDENKAFLEPEFSPLNEVELNSVVHKGSLDARDHYEEVPLPNPERRVRAEPPNRSKVRQLTRYPELIIDLETYRSPKKESATDINKPSVCYHNSSVISCENFKYSAPFHPKNIVNINWKPFYIWHPTQQNFDLYGYTFSYVSEKVVLTYYNNFAKYLNKVIRWANPKMLLKKKAHNPQESLLIAGEYQGHYYIIVNAQLPEYIKRNNITLPISSMRVKTVDRYLVLMSCEANFAVMLAPQGLEPRTDAEKRRAAELSGFEVIDGVPF